MDDREPYIYKTTDFGATWKSVRGDLPSKHPLDYTLSIAENPNRTRHAVRRHRPRVLLLARRRREVDAVQGRPAGGAGDAGSSCRSCAHDVVVSTYGRGLFILDDITPLEQPATAPTDGGAAVRAARRRSG